MEPRTVEQVESWSSRSVADGYAGLRELSDGEFSGAVRAGGAWLFMLNGRVIGVFEGSMDDVENADGTAYAAPHPSLPLLFAMQERGGETQAKYYTNDTPLPEVDDTLSDGKFTGYVELSENVLSGDYYVAYYGGRSLSVAFVGASEQVVTGDEAFERAADEVGIYEVTDVDLEVLDVPEPEDGTDETPDAAAGATGSASDAGADAPGDESDAGGATGGPRDAGTGRSNADAGSGRSNADAGTAGGTAGAGTDAGGRASDDPSGGTPGGATSGGEASPSGPDSTDEPTTGDDPPGVGDDPAGTTGPSADAATTDANEPAGSPTGAAGSQSGTTDDGSAADPDRAASPQRTADDGQTDAARSDAQSADAERSDATSAEAQEPASATGSTGGTGRSESASRTGGDADTAGGGSGATGGGSDATGGGSDATGAASGATEGEAEWRETATIPSLDPDLSEGPDGDAAATGATADRRSSDSATRTESRSGAGSGRQGGSRAGRDPDASAARTSDAASGDESDAEGSAGSEAAGGSSRHPGGSGSGTGGAGGSTGGASTEDDGAAATGNEDGARVRELRKQLRQREQQVEQLKERLSTLESERNEFKRERDALRQEVERLEAKLEGAPGSNGDDAGRQLTPAEAFEGTNLFVRYRSKGEATLDEAADGQADRADVNDNLRLEHHTQFEADDAGVDGEPFEAFLTGSFEYAFVTWLVEDLLYEIRDTGHRDALGDLYEAIPKIDRVDLHGSVSAGSDDEDTRQESFDVIVRDRMGDPLVVADLNDSRDPTSGEMMGSLVESASGVVQRYDGLAGAFQVTESFFEPEALETADAATSGGFLSREKRASFVKLSRKRGYHLCLVEARGGDFHLNVPEL